MGTSRCPAAPTVRKGPAFPAQAQRFAVLVPLFRARRGVENQHPPHSGPGPTPAPRHLVPQMPLGWDPGPSRGDRPPHSSNSGRPAGRALSDPRPQTASTERTAPRPVRAQPAGKRRVAQPRQLRASAPVLLLPGPKPTSVLLRLPRWNLSNQGTRGPRTKASEPGRSAVSLSLRCHMSLGLNTRPSWGFPRLFNNSSAYRSSQEGLRLLSTTLG